MDDDLKELFQELYKDAAEQCVHCVGKCFVYLLTTYINENGYEYFKYQHAHNTLPSEINAAFNKFLSVLEVSNMQSGINVDPSKLQSVINVVVIPWCNSPLRPN